jgi:hypothetical protein
MDLSEISKFKRGDKAWELDILRGYEGDYLIPMTLNEPLQSKNLRPVYISGNNYFFNSFRLTMSLDRLADVSHDIINTLSYSYGLGEINMSVSAIVERTELVLEPNMDEVRESIAFLSWFKCLKYYRENDTLRYYEGRGYDEYDRFREVCDSYGWESLIDKLVNNDNRDVIY